MEKIQIARIIACNRVIYKMFEQKNIFDANTGFKLYSIMKKFDEVEDYVFDTMDNMFDNVDIGNLSETQLEFYNTLVLSCVELEIDKIEKTSLENSKNLMLTLEDIENLTIIMK